MTKLHKALLQNAIDKANASFDSYNFDRYSAILNRNQKLTKSEIFDINLYLGRN